MTQLHLNRDDTIPELESLEDEVFEEPNYASLKEESTENEEYERPVYASIERSPRGSKRTKRQPTPPAPKKMKPTRKQRTQQTSTPVQKREIIRTRPRLISPHLSEIHFETQDETMNNMENEMQIQMQQNFEEIEDETYYSSTNT